MGADMVLVVMVENFQLEQIPDTKLYKGLLDTQSVLIDVRTGEKLWPKSEQSRIVRVGFETESRGQDVAVSRLAMASAYCTTRYLYDCYKNKFRIMEDRSRAGTESWD